MILLSFTIILWIANIYCYRKKMYLYLFIPCMLFLPSYYGIDLIEPLPIITASRTMLVIFLIYSYRNRRRNLNIKKFSLKSCPKEYVFLAWYFFFRIITNLYYAPTNGQSIKTLISIVLEQFFLLVAIYMLAPTKEELALLIKVLIWTAVSFFVLGVLESITSVRIFDGLYSVFRVMLNDHYIRLGFLRATTSFGLPNLYGNMCMLFFPFLLYFRHVYKEKKYIFAIIMCIFAIIHSGCRSNLIFIVIISAIYFIYVLSNSNERKQFIRDCGLVLTVSVLAMTILSLANNHFRYYYVGTAKSLLNEVGFNFDLNEGAPEGVDGYGRNKASGRLSRTNQFSSVYYALADNFAFGLGSGAQYRGILKYKDEKGIRLSNTYDMGIVEILCDEGIIGFLGYIMLFIFIAKLILKAKKHSLSYYKIATMGVITYLLSTLSTINMTSFLFIFLFILCIKNETSLNNQ